MEHERQTHAMPSIEAHGGIFVAEVGVPVAFHGGRTVRQPLDDPGWLGLSRGCWGVWYSADATGAEWPIGLLLTIEFSASALTEAEDRALSVATRLGYIASFQYGAPVQPPRLVRLARVGVAGVLAEQWNYFYDTDRPASIQLLDPELREFVRRVGQTTAPDRDRIEAAMRWYTISLGGYSALDQYAALWFGLEAVGPPLAKLFHPDGPRVACDVCGNQAGASRDGGLAGVDHMIKRIAPELTKDHTGVQLHGLRGEIAHPHPLRPVDELIAQVTPLLDDLRLVLSASVLTARGGTASEQRFGWLAALPRDNTVRPDARSHVWSDHFLGRPYNGQWVKVVREVEIDRAGVDNVGIVERDFRVKLNHGAAVTSGGTLSREYQPFERGGVQQMFEADPDSGLLALMPWRPTLETDAWRRVRTANNAEVEAAR